MVERVPMPKNTEPEAVSRISDASSTANNCLDPPNPASNFLLKGISNSVSETFQRLWIQLRRSIQAFSTRRKRIQTSASENIRTETTVETKSPEYAAPVENGVCSSEQRCNDGELNSHEDVIPLAVASVEIDHVRDARDGAQSRSKQRIRSVSTSEVADFMDLDDPFACYTAGSPRVVKNLDSVLPPTYRFTNKVVEARRRFRRSAQRPQSVGRRPGSAGRRPGSANGGMARQQVDLRVRLSALTQSASSRGARPRLQTPKEPPTPRLTETRPSSRRECSTLYGNPFTESELNALTSQLATLSIIQQQTNTRLKAASRRTSARTVTSSHRPKRAPATSSRPAAPKRRLTYTPLSPFTPT